MAELTPDAVPADPAADAVVPPDPELGEGGKRAVAAERAARKAAEKDRAELAARLKEYEDRDKSEVERQADRLAALTTERDTLAAEKARYQAALTHGLSVDDLALLGAGSADDIAARAALLAQRLSGVKPEPPRLPASPNAGREPAIEDDDAAYAAFEAHVFPNLRRQ